MVIFIVVSCAEIMKQTKALLTRIVIILQPIIICIEDYIETKKLVFYRKMR